MLKVIDRGCMGNKFVIGDKVLIKDSQKSLPDSEYSILKKHKRKSLDGKYAIITDVAQAKIGGVAMYSINIDGKDHEDGHFWIEDAFSKTVNEEVF